GTPGADLRSIYSETRTQQQSFGLRGELEGIDGSWDLIVSEGTAKLDLLLKGYASLESVRSVFTRFPNWGTGMFIQGNAGPPGNGFSGGVARCTSGMPVFRSHDQVSQDCLEAIFRDLNHQSEMEQQFIELNFEGHLVDMPAGEARFSAGVHSRENEYFYNYDPLQTSDHFVDNPMGFAASSNEGSTSVDEIYGELLVPLLNDKWGAEHLNLELGYRYSDYELQGGVDTYKALIDWGITPTLRFRGGKQLATRAPNIAEMFQAETLSWYFSGTGDPCGVNSNASYGANPTANPSGWQQARALCASRMGAIAAEWYGPGFPQPNGASWTPFVNTTGTPNVGPEEADTWTAGFVWRPDTGREALDGLQMSIDWYDIEITDMIAPEAAEVVYQSCLSQATNPTADPNHQACLRVFRNPGSGGAAPTTVGYVNAAFSKVAGTDLTVDWASDLAGGTFGLNFMVTYLMEMKTQASARAPVYDWKGSLGPGAATSLNNGAYDYRTFTTVRYGRGDWNLSLRWRHLPEAIDGEQVVSAVATQRGAEEDYNVFDLTGTLGLGNRTTLRFGVENLFDEPPVITGRRTAADPSPSNGSMTTEAGFYDILGRQFFVGVNAAF
ncbi:MAG: TonB-dependent receptor, partial [Lysobacterales bacterium]